MSIHAIREAYAQATGLWTGCDWPTCFGGSHLDLEGMTAARAKAMAVASSCSSQETVDWGAAAMWLTQVEQDARRAEEEAEIALALAEVGKLEKALLHARRACSLEERHRQPSVWRPFCEAVDDAVGGRVAVGV